MTEGIVDWPEELVSSIIDNRCIMFIGAGVSNSIKFKKGERIPTWHLFLKIALEKLKSESANKVKKLIEMEQYLDALEIIKNIMDPAEYTKLLKDNYTCLINNIQYPGALSVIFNLNLPVIISTNFDTTYEDYCISNTVNKAYSIFNYDKTKEIVETLKSSESLIIKAHGSIREPDHIIFTKSEYYEFMRNRPEFFEILKALFMTRTVLFVGYSLNDPDINILLNSVNSIGLMSYSKPHYILLAETERDDYKLNHWKNNFNVRPVFYEKGKNSSYENFVPALVRLHAQVMSKIDFQRGPTPL